MPLVPSGRYRKRVEILTVSYAAAGANNERVASWPTVTATYSAAVESFAANEVVAQGMNHATGSKRLRIRGRAITVTTADKLRDKVTGEEFFVNGVARDDYDTLLDVSRVKGQETAQ